MPRPSTIQRLPPEIREAIGRLKEQGKTLDEILAHLQALEVDVSRSALGRHVKSMAVMGERLRRSRAMAEGLARQLGETPADKMARLNIELLHSVVNDLLAAADGEEGGILVAKDAGVLATAIERLTKAARQDQDFVLKLENRVKDEAAKTVAAAGRDQGLTEETITAITRRILGIAA